MIFFLNDKDHHWLYFVLHFGVLEVHGEITFVFPINFEFLGTVQERTRIYFYGKFNVWIIIV